mgnify:FL=1
MDVTRLNRTGRKDIEMETPFTPGASLLGGVLIGFASVLLMLLHGRIAGITGILTGLLSPASLQDWIWRAAMIAGMATAPLAMLAATGSMPAIQVPVTTAALFFGGVIVGVGAILGGGCTSGHGVCGLARLSLRSVVATLTFMATTAATVFFIRHLIGG